MRAADLWVNERVLVTSVTNGQRLETYVIEGKEGSGEIVINGAAAHLIGTGQMVTIMAFALTEKPMVPSGCYWTGRTGLCRKRGNNCLWRTGRSEWRVRCSTRCC